ncbi:MAG TPA: class I SAM-dependent methyltransferase family protein [Nitrososphaeraceae archaeon]|jgi:tRNA (guanine37-N1)-methyltransferase|nr:class I SAM-dependent methyltransferase family protein [Nitrososphaeraceae archaeon]
MAHILKTILKDVLPPEDISKLYCAFDIVGNIIIIKIPDSLNSKKKIIAETILMNIKSAKSIFAQTSAVQGDYRLRTLEHLAGINCATTEYREHGCRFKVDVSNTYFSPRLSTERIRISKMIADNEIITNMFAGVGTYSILIAKHNKTSKVYSIDSNPIANDLALLNAELNKVQERVIPICGDAREIIVKQLRGTSNRVLMPLPEKAKEFVDFAVMALKQKGMIHYFSHINANSKKLALNNAALDVKHAFSNHDYRILSTRVVREVGPRLYQTVSDIIVTNKRS